MKILYCKNLEEEEEKKGGALERSKNRIKEQRKQIICFGFELEERVDIGPKEEKSKMMEIVVGRQTPRLAKTFL